MNILTSNCGICWPSIFQYQLRLFQTFVIFLQCPRIAHCWVSPFFSDVHIALHKDGVDHSICPNPSLPSLPFPCHLLSLGSSGYWRIWVGCLLLGVGTRWRLGFGVGFEGPADEQGIVVVVLGWVCCTRWGWQILCLSKLAKHYLMGSRPIR